MSKMSGAYLLQLSKKHIGEKYMFVSVPKDNPNWKGPWDCAEFASWLAYQVTGRLYGCIDNSLDASKADAFSGAWARDCNNGTLSICNIEDALTVPGIILIRKPPLGKSMGHIAISDGIGGTVEAAGVNLGVRRGKIIGRTWDYYAKIPELTYDKPRPTNDSIKVPFVIRLTSPLTKSSLVKEIQRSLKNSGFNPGKIDGAFGTHTVSAVGAFQVQNRLIADGIVGPLTAKKLGISWK